MTTKIRTYSELLSITAFKDRFEYLKLQGTVGNETFGFERYFNQKFYHSQEWKSVRDYVIIRDNGCDLGVEGFEIFGKVIVHHMNPILTADIVHCSEILLDPEYLISTTHETHNAIHYGNGDLLSNGVTERMLYDTCPWKQ